jgi:hypothetical protein
VHRRLSLLMARAKAADRLGRPGFAWDAGKKGDRRVDSPDRSQLAPGFSRQQALPEGVARRVIVGVTVR